LGGKVKILDPLLWNGQEQTFAVNAGGSSVVSFEFPGIPEEKAYNLKIQITLDDGTTTILNRSISFLAANQAYKAPVIDGSISPDEWVGAMPIVLDQASQVQLISDWGGPSDLSAKGYVKWDKDHFYLALETKDNVHYQTGTAGDIWQGDGIQFAIDPGRKSDSPGLGYNEIGVALNSATSSVVKWRWTAPTGKTTGVMNSMVCQVKRDDSSGTTTYELSIPWSDLLPDGMTAAPGSDFGFSMLINDNDGSGRRGWIEYMSGIGFTKDPSAYGDMVLASVPDLDSVSISVSKPFLKPGETTSSSVSGLMNDGTQADLSKAQIVYTSDNEQVARIDGSGIVTAIGEGTANVKASVTIGNVTKESSVPIITDQTPPAFNLIVNGAAIQPGASFDDDLPLTFSASDPLSGVASAQISVNGTVYGADPQSQSATIDMAGKSGSYTAVITCEDKAGNKLTQNFPFVVTTSISSMRVLVDRYGSAGELDGTVATQLRDYLDQAQHQLDIARKDQAAKIMVVFIDYLNKMAAQGLASQHAKDVLNSDAQALIQLWS
jgi:hypothetical protein